MGQRSYAFLNQLTIISWILHYIQTLLFPQYTLPTFSNAKKKKALVFHHFRNHSMFAVANALGTPATLSDNETQKTENKQRCNQNKVNFAKLK